MKAGLRLVLITSIALFLLGLGWLSLKVLENNEPTQPGTWHHPMTDLAWWNLQRPTQCTDSKTLKKEIESANKEAVWFLDAQVQKENWVVFCSLGSSSELYQRFQEGIPLKEILPLFTTNERFVLFNLHASQEAEAESFLKEVSALEKLDHIAVVSASRVLLEKIRKERPQWLFGSDRTTWTKVLAMNSIYLTGIVSLWPDFFIISEAEQAALGMKNSIYDFMKQKNKILIQEVSAETAETSATFGNFRGRLFTSD